MPYVAVYVRRTYVAVYVRRTYMYVAVYVRRTCVAVYVRRTCVAVYVRRTYVTYCVCQKDFGGSGQCRPWLSLPMTVQSALITASHMYTIVWDTFIEDEAR